MYEKKLHLAAWNLTPLSIRLGIWCLAIHLISPVLAQESAPSSASANFPSGSIEGPFVWESKIYPGTVRNYWVYVPARYDAGKPACSMIVQDGLGWMNPGAD